MNMHKQQQTFLNILAYQMNVVAFRPDYHAKDDDKNTVMFYMLEDEVYNRQIEAKYQGNPPSEMYRKPFFTFENSDTNNFATYCFANHGSIDLRSADWQIVLEAAIRYHYTKHAQMSYAQCFGGIANVKEADEIYNEFNRALIRHYARWHKGAVLVRMEEDWSWLEDGRLTPFHEYNENEMVKNFDCSYVIPCQDEELRELIFESHKSVSVLTENLPKIDNRVRALGGFELIWK